MKQIHKQTEEQRAKVARLLAHQRPGQADAKFWRESLLPFEISSSTWSRLKSDTYTAKLDGVFERVDRALNELDHRKRADQVAGPDGIFHALPHTAACETSVVECARRLDKKRITVLLGETGAGKSVTGRHLYKTLGGNKRLFPGGALMLEATPSWRTYKSALHDFAGALGLSGPWRDTQNVEADVVAELRQRGPTLVVIDECQYFSEKSADLTKFFTNQTPAVLFLVSEPVLWEQFKKRSWAASSQIINRCRAVIRVTALSRDDVKPFLAHADLNGQGAAIADEIARAATLFGRFDRVKDIVWWMREAKGDVWTIENVRDVIGMSERNQGLRD